MALTKSVRVRNAQLDAIETTIGASPILKIRSGPAPAHCSDPSTGTVLATLNLPADWMNDASGGSKTLLGTWQDLSADNPGTAAHFEVMDNTDSLCDLRGSVSGIGDGGDMEVSNVDFATGQPFSITAFTLVAGGA